MNGGNIKESENASSKDKESNAPKPNLNLKNDQERSFEDEDPDGASESKDEKEGGDEDKKDDAEKSDGKGEDSEIVTHCVQGYPQTKDDPEGPRLAYWTCNTRVESCCRVLFVGCGKNLCDLHCRKFDEFKKGKKNGQNVMRTYLSDHCCHECYPAYVEARERANNWFWCLFTGLCIIFVIIIAIVTIIAIDVN